MNHGLFASGDLSAGQVKNIRAWIADLRTPGLKQTKCKLFGGKGHCCLGRACVVLGMEAFKRGPDWYFDDDCAELTCDAAVLFGLDSTNGTVIPAFKGKDSLADMNDSGWRFSKIADFIESELNTKLSPTPEVPK